MLDQLHPFLAIFRSGWTASWPTQLLGLIWIVWVVSWVVGSFFSGRTEKRVMTGASLAFHLPMIAGAVLMTPWIAQILGERPLWHLSNGSIYLLEALTVAGTLFTWWARIHLGRFWSNAITRKEDHRVVDTGPYGLVRHPIYTGLIGAMLATSIAIGTVTALLGMLLITFGLWRKARMEEGFLTTELGAEAYGPYCRRVPMLIPFLPQG
jgi:protein-S-isoprenylcysteine O-methyltransferase Ste14